MNKQKQADSYRHVFKTRLGWVACLGSKNGLKRVTLPHISKESAVASLGYAPDAIAKPPFFNELEKKLQDYYSGKCVEFNFPLDLSDGTPFRQKVWQAIKTIPYGETRSYAWIAQQVGKPGAARAAGQAVGDNPLGVVVPCHRVVAADGSIGGFGKGLKATDLKRKLLKLEKAVIK